jgi:hypothetical protein
MLAAILCCRDSCCCFCYCCLLKHSTCYCHIHSSSNWDLSLLTDSMELGPSWEASSYAATQKLPYIRWNSKVHYHVLKSPPLVPILSQINQVYTTPFFRSKIHFNIIHPATLCFPSGLFSSGFPTNILYAFLSVLIRVTCPAYLILLDLSILIILGTEY